MSEDLKKKIRLIEGSDRSLSIHAGYWKPGDDWNQAVEQNDQNPSKALSSWASSLEACAKGLRDLSAWVDKKDVTGDGMAHGAFIHGLSLTDALEAVERFPGLVCIDGLSAEGIASRCEDAGVDLSDEEFSLLGDMEGAEPSLLEITEAPI